MATRRKNNLVLGLFKNNEGFEKLFKELHGAGSSSRGAIVFTNHWQQQEIEKLIAESLPNRTSSYKQLLGKKTGGAPKYRPMTPEQRRIALRSYLQRRRLLVSTEHTFELPESQVVIGVDSPRASQYSRLFKRFGALEVLQGAAPYIVESAARTALNPVFVINILDKIAPGQVRARAVGKASLINYGMPVNHSISDYLAPLHSGDEDGASASDDDDLWGQVRSNHEDLVIALPSTTAPAPPPVMAAPPRAAPPMRVIVGSGGDGIPPRVTMPKTDQGDGPIERFIEGRFPLKIAAGEKCNLEVRIAITLERGTKSASIASGVLPEGKDSEVLLLLHAPDFTIGGEQRGRTVKVQPKGNSEFAMWELTPQATGSLPLSITAYYGSSQLGELKIEAEVMTGMKTGPSATSSSIVQFETPDPGQITLEIQFDETNQVYTCNFVSTGFHSDDIKSGVLKRPPELAINALIADLNDIARGKKKIAASQMPNWLRGKGLELWLEFVPEKLQTLFWEQRTNIHRLRILSAGDPVPWELLYPTQPGGSPDPTTGFLGESFDLTRWRFGRSPVAKLRSGRTCFVLPPSAPKQAIAEVDCLQGILGNDSVRVDSLQKLTEVLESRDFGILHFACHNSFDLNKAKITMADGDLEPSTLLNYIKRFDSPFIFMNACRTDGKTQSYTKLGGWANSFLDTGVGAFVGSLWEIRDTSAATFAATLYSQLKTQPLGDAIASARKSINTSDGDPTWLAYSVYGSPAARISQ